MGCVTGNSADLLRYALHHITCDLKHKSLMCWMISANRQRSDICHICYFRSPPRLGCDTTESRGQRCCINYMYNQNQNWKLLLSTALSHCLVHVYPVPVNICRTPIDTAHTAGGFPVYISRTIQWSFVVALVSRWDCGSTNRETVWRVDLLRVDVGRTATS